MEDGPRGDPQISGQGPDHVPHQSPVVVVKKADGIWTCT